MYEKASKEFLYVIHGKLNHTKEFKKIIRTGFITESDEKSENKSL